ncbi:hypothetical protein Tco_0883848 [Tanacetum coccineum]
MPVQRHWVSALAATYAPPPENSLLAQTGDMATFMDWYYKRQGLTELIQKDLKGPAFEIVKVFHPDVIHLQYQMEECHKLLTDQVDDAILRYGSKGSTPALSISKMEAAYYPDVGLEQIVPDQMWLEEECKINVAAYVRYLSLVLSRIEVSESQLPPTDKKILHYCGQLLDKKLVVTFWDKYGVQMIMRFNEIYKFSDDTLQQIDEALDYRVKEFKVNRMNPRLNTRFWSTKDVNRSKEFMFAIQKQLKTRRIFCSLERFVDDELR